MGCGSSAEGSVSAKQLAKAGMTLEDWVAIVSRVKGIVGEKEVKKMLLWFNSNFKGGVTADEFRWLVPTKSIVWTFGNLHFAQDFLPKDCHWGESVRPGVQVLSWSILTLQESPAEMKKVTKYQGYGHGQWGDNWLHRADDGHGDCRINKVRMLEIVRNDNVTLLQQHGQNGNFIQMIIIILIIRPRPGSTTR